MIGIWIYCLTPLVAAGTVDLEHHLLWWVKLDSGTEQPVRPQLSTALVSPHS